MSRAIEECNSVRKPAPELRRRFKALALAISFCSMGLPLLTAYSQTVSVAAPQEPPGVKAQIAYIPRIAAVDGVRLPEISSLDIPLLIRDSDRLGAAMHLRLPEYTYLQTRLSRELDQRGKMIEHVSAYEAYPIIIMGHHRHVISLISEGGAPISPKRLKKERQQAAKEIEAAERESGGQDNGAPTTGAERYV